MPSFKDFEKQVLPVLRKKKIDRLVFDMRFNRGGYAPQGTEFIRKICKSLPREHGDIFVLIGRTTRASAIINTVDLINSAEVVLVGEETGGKPNFFGEVRRFVLPESRIIVSHSTKSFRLLDEDLPTIAPDLMVPIDYESYMKGIDPAIEAVRHHMDPCLLLQDKTLHNQVLGRNISKHNQEARQRNRAVELVECNHAVGKQKQQRTKKNQFEAEVPHSSRTVQGHHGHSYKRKGIDSNNWSHHPLHTREKKHEHS